MISNRDLILVYQIVVVQSLSCIQLFVTTWTAALQTSLSFTISLSLLKFMSIDSVMPERASKIRLKYYMEGSQKVMFFLIFSLMIMMMTMTVMMIMMTMIWGKITQKWKKRRQVYFHMVDLVKICEVPS